MNLILPNICLFSEVRLLEVLLETFIMQIDYNFTVDKENKLNFLDLFLKDFYDPIFMSLFLPKRCTCAE